MMKTVTQRSNVQCRKVIKIALKQEELQWDVKDGLSITAF